MSSLKLGSSTISNAKLGSTQVSQIYQGSNLIWTNATTTTTTTTAGASLVSGYKVLFDFGNPSSYSGTGTGVANLGSGGSAMNGSLVNSPVWTSANGGTVTLEKASSQYIQFDTAISASFTTMAIIKHDGSGTSWGTSATDYNGFPNIRGDNGIIITGNIDGNTQTLAIIWSGGGASVPSGNFIYPSDISIYHSYAYTSNGTNDHNMYLDNGTAANSNASLSRGDSGTITSYIGRDAPNNGYLNGKVMAYLQYDRVLTSAEIAQNYAFFSPRF
jgi:hypothetical protein